MMKRVFLFLCACISMCLTAVGQTGHFIPADRFSNSIISDLCQDKYGNIWVATDYGLNKYDGYSFTTYLHDDADATSLCNNAVVSLLCDREGRLWVGTNRGLDRYSPENGTFAHYPFPEGYLPRVCDLLQLSDGTVLVCTPGYGVFAVGDDDALHLANDYSFDDEDVYFVGMFEDSKHRVWKHDGGNEFVMKADYRFTKLESLFGGVVGFVERGDEVLIVCSQGFMSYQGGELAVADIDMSVLGSKEVNFNVVETDAEGNIYKYT